MMKTHKIVSCVVCFFCWFSTFCLVTVPTPIFSVGSLIKNLPVIYPPSTVCGDNMLTDTKMKTIQLIKDNCILPVHVFHFNADWLFLSLAAFLVHRPAAAASTALHACSTRQHGLQSQWRRRGNFPGTSCSHSSFG